MMHITPGELVGALTAFLVTRSVGGVVGEYGKRLWFQRIEPFLARLVRWLEPQKYEYSISETKLSEIESELAWAKALAARVIQERDELSEEVARLRVSKNSEIAAERSGEALCSDNSPDEHVH